MINEHVIYVLRSSRMSNSSEVVLQNVQGLCLTVLVSYLVLIQVRWDPQVRISWMQQVFYRLDALLATWPMTPKHWKDKICCSLFNTF